MSEIELTDDQANALHGTTDAETDFKYHAPGDASYFTEGQRQRHRLLTLAKAISNSLRVYRDGSLTFGVRPGAARDGDTVYNHAGCEAQDLTDDATNYVYLTADDLAAGDSASVSTNGFPDQSQTPHVPLAEIVTAAGTYDADDITDRRAAAAMTLGSGMSADQANTLAGGAGSNADDLHVHDVAGLADGVRALMPLVSVTGTDNANGTGSYVIQVCDSDGQAIAGKFRLRCWTSNGDCGEHFAALAFDHQMGYGTVLREIEADLDYEVITNSSGQCRFTVVAASDATHWVSADVGGLIRAGSASITGTGA